MAYINADIPQDEQVPVQFEKALRKYDENGNELFRILTICAAIWNSRRVLPLPQFISFLWLYQRLRRGRHVLPMYIMSFKLFVIW